MRHRHLAVLLASFALLLAGLVTAPAGHALADRDCGDFDTQAQAQKFFLDQGGPHSDPHGLDSDGDGIACESNPCPCSTDKTGGDAPAVKRQKARMVRVIDGDTIEADLTPGPRVDVRLIGIDTPEVHGGVECGGRAASRSARRMLPKGTRLVLVSDPSQDLKDRYGRLLRYVMKGSVDVNRRQLHWGHARVYVYDGNPFRRVKTYRKARNSARSHDRGLWGHC